MFQFFASPRGNGRRREVVVVEQERGIEWGICTEYLLGSILAPDKGCFSCFTNSFRSRIRISLVVESLVALLILCSLLILRD